MIRLCLQSSFIMEFLYTGLKITVCRQFAITLYDTIFENAVTMSELLRSKNNRSRNLMVAILILFSAMAVARLNQLYFFAPDSADYVLMAKGLINHFEYRQIDFPGAPYFTIRPPGLSVLLIPAAILSPYNAIFAKVTILLTAIMMLFLMYTLMRHLKHDEAEPKLNHSSASDWPILLIILLTATNPHIFLYSTIIMSEIPYMALTLGIIYLISLDEEQIKKRNLILVTVLLMFLPLLRTIGIALILAMGIWAIAKRKRWPYLISVFCSSATILLWMLRNRALKSDIYTASTITDIKSSGFVGTLLSMCNRSLNYFEIICHNLIPDTPGMIPRYERYLLDGNHTLPGPQLIYYSVSVLIIAISLYGMLKCWKRGGAVSLLYLSISLGILSLWPWVQPRYILPLIPIMLAFVPMGCISLGKRIASTKQPPAVLVTGLIIVAGISLVISQIKTDFSMIYANQQFKTQGKAFYQTHFPSGHYSNFVEAGHWIKNHTPKDARLLTSRPEVGTTANRFQKQISFGQISPEKLHQLIQSFKAKYVVCHDQFTEDSFPRHLLDNDLIYRLTPVYQKSGVIVLKIQPNYEGTIRHEYWQENESLNLATKKYEKFPERISSQVAYMKQMLAAEKYKEAIDFIHTLPEVSDVRLVNFLGWAYVGNRQYKKALKEFSRATRMPGQSAISQSIRRGGRLSQKHLTDKTNPDQKTSSASPRIQLRMANEYWKLANFKKARELALKVLDLEEADTKEVEQAHVLLARLYLIEGNKKLAIEELKRIPRENNNDDLTLLKMLELEDTLNLIFIDNKGNPNEDLQKLDTQQRATILELISIYDSLGVPGKSLKLLMQTHEIAPDDRQILDLLAQRQLFYNLIPEAEASYLKLRKMRPDDQNIKAALLTIETLKKVPGF